MSHAARPATRPSAPPAAETAPSVDRLAFGINLASDVVLAVSLVFFVFDWGNYPMRPLTIAAWVVLIAVVVLTQLGLARRVRLPGNWWTIARIAFGVVLVLDVFGVLDSAGSSVWGPYPDAAIGIGAGLSMFATTQRQRSINWATAALGILVVADIALTARDLDNSINLVPGIVAIATAVIPPILAVSIVRSFNNMVEFQSDLSQAKGTTSAPGVSMGLSASAQLVRLDAQAERLLDDVASGRTPLPLPEVTAEEASMIAAQLRMNLVAGKSETWLYHALNESAVLGSISTADDPDGLAARLAPDQRDGLLTAIWMLAGDGERVAQSLAVKVRRASNAGAQTQRLAISIELIGVPKRRIDPTAWQAISRVGRYSEFSESPTLRIDIDCALDVVADR